MNQAEPPLLSPSPIIPAATASAAEPAPEATPTALSQSPLPSDPTPLPFEQVADQAASVRGTPSAPHSVPASTGPFAISPSTGSPMASMGQNAATNPQDIQALLKRLKHYRRRGPKPQTKGANGGKSKWTPWYQVAATEAPKEQ